MLLALNIDNGEFDVNGVSEMGWTPLHLAAYEGWCGLSKFAFVSKVRSEFGKRKP